MNTDKLVEIIKSKWFTIAIVVLFAFALLVGTFSVGVMVGYRKAKFTYAWGDNYHRNFGGPRGGFMKELGKDMMGGDFIGAHGTFGQIIDIKDSELAVRGRDNIEKIVVINPDTDIRRFRDSITVADLKKDEFIVVIGEPNDIGQTVAKFIRVMPSPEDGPMMIRIKR